MKSYTHLPTGHKSCEIKRNTGGNGYHYKQAHNFAKTRHPQKNKRIKLNDDLRHYIQQKLGLYWSPEQVSGRLRMEENIRALRGLVWVDSD